MAEGLHQGTLPDDSPQHQRQFAPVRRHAVCGQYGQEEGRMTNHEFLFPGTGIHDLFQEETQFDLDGGHRHAAGMAAAAYKDVSHEQQHA